MVYKRYIYRNGKKFGPYYYHTYRDKEGRTHSRYVEKPEEKRAVIHNKHSSNVFGQHKTLFILLGAIFAIFLVIIVLGNQASKQEGISSRDQGEFGFKKIADNVKSFVTGLTSDTPEEPAPGTIDEAPIETPTEEPTEETPEEQTTETPAEDEVSGQANESQTEETTQESSANETQVINQTEESNITVESNESASPEEESEGGEALGNITVNETQGNFTISNETNVTNFTIINETNVANVTLVNETNITIVNATLNITLQESVRQFGAIIGKPVRWEKKVKIDIEGANSASGIVIDLPEIAGNVSVKKIRDDVEEEVDVSVRNERDVDENKEESAEAPASTSFLTTAFNFVLGFFNRGITGRAIDEETGNVEVEINEEIQDNEEIVLEYFTDAPYAEEQELGNGKVVRVIGPENLHYENVLVFTQLNENLNIKDINKVKIYWEENTTYVPFQNVSDINNNGIYDYVEWIVPHLSNQTFNIIVITKAEHLNSNRTFISDIYNEVKKLDGVWSEEIKDSDYVRITFERNLTSDRDITIYPRIVNGTPRIEVYEKEGSVTIAEFSNLINNEYNKVYLSNLQGEQDTFDLRILDGSIEFDHIVDPAPVTLQINSGNLTEDVYYGRLARNSFQTKWSLASIPAGVTINNATACFYEIGNTDGTTDNDANVSRIDNQTWIETLTGATYTSATLSPLTNSSTTDTWNSTSANSWWCINVTNMIITDYNTGNANSTIRFVDLDAVPPNGGLTANSNVLYFGDDTSEVAPHFASSEYATASQRPYLTIVYTTAAEDSAPQWSTNSTNSTSKNTAVKHSVYWTDDVALAGYIFSFDNGNGTLYNDTWVSFTGTTNWSNVTKVVNSTNNSQIRWIVYANDSANQLNVTSTFSYNTTNDAPTQSNPIFLVDPVRTDQNLTCLNQSTSDPNSDIVTNVYNWNVSSTSILLLNLPFDINSSSVAKDYSGFENNGTLNISGAYPLWVSSGRIGGAYNFSWDNRSYIDLNKTLTNTSNGSIAAWVWFNGVSGTNDYAVIANYDGGGFSDGEFLVYFNNDGDLEVFLGATGLVQKAFGSLTNSWQHIAATWTSGNASLYINGTLVNSDTTFTSNVFGFTKNVSIGRDLDAAASPTKYRPFNGSLDNIQIYNRTLSSQQIYQLYLETKDGWSNSSTIVSQETITGENWTCEVTPNDAYLEGTKNINYTTILSPPPKWSSNSTNSTEAGSAVSHNVYWTDETALSGYIFSFDNGTGTLINDSWVSMTGTTNWSNVTKVINKTAGSTIRWMVYANNSDSFLNVTDTFTYNNTCGNLIGSLTLSQNQTSADTCFTIGANNVVLDCNSYTITYGTGENNIRYGIVSSGYNNSIIKNCIIQKNNTATSDSPGIYLHGNVNNNTINSNNITTGSSDYGIYLFSTAYNNSIYSNKITTSASSAYGIALFSTSYNNLIYSNTINTSGISAFGIVLTLTSYNNSVYSNIINTNGSSASGIRFASTSYNNLVYSNTINTSGISAYGIHLITNISNNNFTDNTITTTASSIYLDGTGNAIYNNLFANSTISNGSATNVQSTVNAYSNTLLNMTFNKSKVVFTSCTSCNLTVQWYYRTNATDQRSVAVSGATVTVKNVSGTQIDSQSTDSNGLTNYIRVAEYVQNGSSSYTAGCTGSGGNITCATPHNVTASKIGYSTNSTNVTIDSSMIKVIIIPTPYILAYVPTTDNFSIAEPNNQTFSIEFTNTTSIYIKWFVNGTQQSAYNNLSQFNWTGNYTQAGVYQIKVNISNGVGEDDQIWIMTVNDTNTAPTHNNPLLSPYPPADSQNLTCTNQSTSDAEGDSVTNIYNWLMNGTSLMVLNLPFDNQTTSSASGAIKDYSGFGNNGTLSASPNTPIWNSSGRIGGAYTFNDNESMNITKSSSLNDTYNFSIEFWYNPKDLDSGTNLIFTNSPDFTVNNGEVFIEQSSSSLLTTLRNSGGGIITRTSSSVFTQDVWQHIVIVETSGKNLTIYKNGTLIDNLTSSTAGPFLTSSTNFSIGSLLGDPTASPINGTLDNFRIWNRSLSALQVYQLYLDTKDGYSNSSTIVSQETVTGENWTCEVTPNDKKLDGILKINSTTISSDFSVAIDLSPWLTQQVNWSLASLPANNQSAEGNNGTGITLYWVNVSVTGGSADLYMKANDNLTSPGGDKILLGNESYSYNTTNNTVPSDTKTPLTTSYSSHLIGDNLPEGNTLVYLKFFLSAPSSQPAGTYNNTPQFKAVEDGQSP